MNDDQQHKQVWLAADYHFPSVYSCRMPMSSMSSTLALPTPGPSTVRLALIRTGLEVFGELYTRDVLFPIIRSMPIFIRPPEQIALSHQFLQSYKGTPQRDGSRVSLEESIMNREVGHANGNMTIYVNIPQREEGAFSQLFMTIGYWGKADSFTWCTGTQQEAPLVQACAKPLSAYNSGEAVRPHFTSVVADFADRDLAWEHVIAQHGHEDPMLTMTLFVWPIVQIERRGSGRVLLHQSILSRDNVVVE